MTAMVGKRLCQIKVPRLAAYCSGVKALFEEQSDPLKKLIEYLYRVARNLRLLE